MKFCQCLYIACDVYTHLMPEFKVSSVYTRVCSLLWIVIFSKNNLYCAIFLHFIDCIICDTPRHGMLNLNSRLYCPISA